MVRAAEADWFAGMGEPVGGLWHVIESWILRNWKKFVWGAFNLLVATLLASLLLPAATKQWADRQAALTLKSSVTTDLSESVVSAVRTAQHIAEMTREDEARKARDEALDAWVIGEAKVDPVYNLYFSGTEALGLWNEYRDAIFKYIQFVCCDKNRKAELKVVLDYFRKYSLPDPSAEDAPKGTDLWSTLSHSSLNDVVFVQVYQSVGNLLLGRRGFLMSQLLLEHTSGYSDSFSDFWRDVWGVVGHR